MDFNFFYDQLSGAFRNYVGGILQTLPSIGAGLLLLLVGWGLARAVRKLIQRLVQRTGLQGAAERSGLERVFGRLGGMAVVAGTLVYWLVHLFFILASAQVMDLAFVTEAVHRFFNYLPILLTSVGIFVFGVWLGERVQDLAIRLSGSVGLIGGKILGRIFFGVIVLFMSITALNMAGVDTTLITSNILLLTGGILVAFSVAYGIASRDILSNILGSYYAKERFKPGMRLKIGGDEGVIESIDSVNIALNTGDKVVLLPTRQLMTERIEVLSTEEPAQ